MRCSHSDVFGGAPRHGSAVSFGDRKQRIAPVDTARKKAYRYVLYWALLECRRVRWIAWSWKEKLNPLCWGRIARNVRAAGGLCEWLHNLALFSALDFDRFDEDRFWADYELLRKHHGKEWLTDYREFFAQRLGEFSAGDAMGTEPAAGPNGGPAKAVGGSEVTVGRQRSASR